MTFFHCFAREIRDTLYIYTNSFYRFSVTSAPDFSIFRISGNENQIIILENSQEF